MLAAVRARLSESRYEVLLAVELDREADARLERATWSSNS
jgi:hypothetical protein